jgi:DNA polymerase (family 10)
VRNREVASLLSRIADLWEFKGENRFKVVAFRRAAMIVENMAEDIEALWHEDRLEEIGGIGAGISGRIGEYLATGRIQGYEEEARGISPGLLQLMDLPGIGPSTVRAVHDALGVEDIAGLERAAREGKLREVAGMGAKKEQNVLRALEIYRRSQERIPLGVALPEAEAVVDALRRQGFRGPFTPAGSLRRMSETVGDIDILATDPDPERLLTAFAHLPFVRHVLAAGGSKGSVVTEANLQVDLRVVAEESFGAALQYFTGSKQHNVHLRGIARARGMKVNEYGVFRGEERLAGRTEEEVYAALELPLIPPEIREDTGEIEAAMEGRLPRLIEEADIRGDLHVHSRWSDGINRIEELARAAKGRGYSYLALTDHSPTLRIAHGLDAERLSRQRQELAEVARSEGFTLLPGSEVDIRRDGSLDWPDDELARLEVVVASIHSGFKDDEETMTGRIIAAIRHPAVNIIAHPTGRLIGSREPYRVNLPRVFEAAAQAGCALEINAFYNRLDLSGAQARMAKGYGVKFSVATDAHQMGQLGMIRFGVGQARKGWLTPEDVINTWDIDRLRAFLAKGRRAQ